MVSKWMVMTTFIFYWILLILSLFAAIVLVVLILHHLVEGFKGLVIYIRRTKDERTRAVRVVDESQFKDVTNSAMHFQV